MLDIKHRDEDNINIEAENFLVTVSQYDGGIHVDIMNKDGTKVLSSSRLKDEEVEEIMTVNPPQDVMGKAYGVV